MANQTGGLANGSEFFSHYFFPQTLLKRFLPNVPGAIYSQSNGPESVSSDCLKFD